MHACYKPADLLRTAGARKHFLSLTTITCYSWKKLPLGWRAVVLITMGSTGHDLCCWYLSDVVLLEVRGVSASWEGRCSRQSCNPWKNLKLLGCCNCYSTLFVTVPGKYFCSSVRWNNLNWRMNECYELCVNTHRSFRDLHWASGFVKYDVTGHMWSLFPFSYWARSLIVLYTLLIIF